MKSISASWKSRFAALMIAGLCFVCTAGAQTLSIVSGEGQLIPNATLAPQQLIVQVNGTNNSPLAGASVTFTVQVISSVFIGTVSPPGSIGGQTVTVVTGTNGQAAVNYTGPDISRTLGSPYFSESITAVSGTSTVTFHETTANVNLSGGGNLVSVSLVSPVQNSSTNFIGQAGSTSTQLIQASVTAATNGVSGTGTGVPNVALTLSSSPAGGISCKEGPFVLSNSAGQITCTPLFGNIGSGSFSIIVGGSTTYTGFSFTVSAGAPATVQYVSGDNQSGAPGAQLPVPLVARVTDLAGNNLMGVPMTFTVSPAGAATFISTISTSDANGRVSTNVVLGNVAGPIKITVTDAAGQIKTPYVFTATVNIAVSSISKPKDSGDGQTAFINAAFGQPLTVQVIDANNQPVKGAPVQFAVTSGSATLSQNSVNTGSDGRASVNVTAGPTAGPVSITASTGGFSTTFSLTVNPPGPVNFSYFNGASNAPDSLSPGSIVTINAQGLLTNNTQGVISAPEFGPLPYIVAGVSVTLNNVPAPIFNVQNLNGQQSVTIQVPFEVPAATVPITIAVNGGGSTTAAVTVLAVSPGIFQTTQSDGKARAVALRPNGTVVTPTNPAGRGENIRIYLTGLGPVNPSISTGNFSPATGPDPVVTSPLLLGLNNAGINIVQAIYARNLIGVYEITFTVPTDTAGFPSGSLPLAVAIQGPSPNGYVFGNGSSIVIQ